MPAEAMIVPAHTECGWTWHAEGPHAEVVGLWVDDAALRDTAERELGLDGEALTLVPRLAVYDPVLTGLAWQLDAEAGEAVADPAMRAALARCLRVHLIRHHSSVTAAAERALERRRDERLGLAADAPIARAIAYLEQHLVSDASVAGAAEAAGLSARHFSRRFRAATGSSPQRWLVVRRAERARELLLAAPDRSLAEVARASGFADPSHMTSMFREVYGTTPARVRTQAGASMSRPVRRPPPSAKASGLRPPRARPLTSSE